MAGALAGTLLAWLVAGRWLLTIWGPAAGDREWLPTTPEVVVVAVIAAGGILLAGLDAEAVLSWIAALSAG